MFSITSLTCGFLFDLDGTLVRTDSLHYSLWKTILSSYGMDLTEDLYHRRIAGRSDNGIWTEWGVGTEEERIQWNAWKEAEFMKRIHETIPVSHAKERIEQWSQLGAWIGVVTNSNQKTACALLDRLGITNYVTLLVSSDSKCKPKPSSEPYEWGMNMLGLNPRQTVVFEDSEVGIQSALHIHPQPHSIFRLSPDHRESDPMDGYIWIQDYCDPRLDVFLGPLQP
jgi:HAD superfamily hydrolase (TIGR01509 family)